ncbi:inositol monophosphatase, partial [Candidatus Falkowbacteria bacterium]|nr:inositol monophosphatase [Candidatus Falkowbacteria bacterium]
MTALQLAKSTSKQAGKELKRLFYSRQFTTQLKSKHEIVTTADKLAEKIIISGINEQFPDHAILAEESGRNKKKSDYLWIIDPLDGTTNFFMHNPLFSVSIGLAYKNEVVMGVVYIPILDELYYAEKGKGAFVDGKRIKVSKTSDIKDTFLTFCHGNKLTALNSAINFYGKLKKTARDFRQLGSAAIECAYVARGITDAIVIPGVKSWDVAAGTILVREAGGKVS